MDYMDTVDFAYNKRKRAEQWGDNAGVLSPQGIGGVSIDDDTLPFVKVAVIRYYLDENGNDSLD